MTEPFGRLDIRRERKGTDDQPLTHHQASELHRRRISVHPRIQLLCGMQAAYIPGAILKATDSTVSETGRADVEDKKLWLPSDFAPTERVTACTAEVAEVEVEYRMTQLRDELEEVRDSQRVIRAYYAFSQKNLLGQAQRTRASAFIEGQNERCKAAQERYAWCRRALASLKGTDESWADEFKVLTPADCVSMAGADFEPDALLPLGQGTFAITWIWRTQGAAGSGDAEMLLSLKSEWLKSRARVARWTEELRLVEEEMRHVRVTLRWMELWWTARTCLRMTADAALLEGSRAYASRQAEIQRDLRETFATLWDNMEDTGNDYQHLP